MVGNVGERRQIYEGKAKIVYEADDPGMAIVYFKDSATAFDGKKRGTIGDKGRCNALISAKLFEVLEEAGVSTHFVKLLDDRTMLVKKLEIIPVEMVVRNISAGSVSKRLGLEEGVAFDEPILEYYYKSDQLGDPMINRYHIRALRLASDAEMDELERLSKRINEVLSAFLDEKELKLVDFKLEFGRYLPPGARSPRIVLGDEITPDTCRLWDKQTEEKLDKDRFRRDLGGVEEAYKEVLRRVTGLS